MIAPTTLEALAADTCSHLDPDKWSIYQQVMATALKRKVPFAVGGGLATMVYTGQSRQSKDVDLFIQNHDRQEMIRIMTECGLVDYYDQLAYDRTWIYRGYIDGAIVDVIWAMANHRALVDRTWIDLGPKVHVDGLQFRLVPPEETLWNKLYILQKDRCDWPDALNLVYAVGPELDWHRLLDRLGEDRPLLSGLLSVFAWVCPDRANELPSWIWDRVELRPPTPMQCLEVASKRADLLDTRPWFNPTVRNNPGE